MKHIEIEKLIEKFEGRMADGDAHEIAAHISHCSECRVTSAKLADFFTYIDQPGVEQVPQAVTAGILNIYQRKPVVETVPVKRHHGLASLIFDDWTMALNERHTGLDKRQMLFRVDGFDVDLRLELIGENCRFTGQVFPEIAGSIVEISCVGHNARAELNEFGEFELDPVPQGIYDIRIVADDDEIIIEKIPLEL